jgi:DNA-binding transcriptional LysR family regulator
MKVRDRSLDLEAVKAFVLTAELQSFTRAANALDTSQAAISVKLRRLEEQLGRRLLERTPRRVRLSAEGAAFFDAARDLVGAHDRAVASFEVERRRLAIGISQHLVGARLPALLRRLNAHDAKLQIELRVAGSREILAALDAGSLDAAIVLQTADSRSGGEALYAETFAWMGAAHWRPRTQEPLPLSTQGESCSMRQAAVRALDAAGIAWTEAFIGQGAACVGAPAAAGLAIAVLAQRAAPPETVDLGQSLGLPVLPTRDVVLHSALHDRRSRAALRVVCDAFRSSHGSR